MAAVLAVQVLVLAACNVGGGDDADGSTVVFQPATESMAVLTQLSAFSGDKFTEQGLKVTYNTPIPNAAQAAQSVTNGADIAIVGSTGVVPGIAAHRDMVTVAQISKGPSTQVTLRKDVIDRLGIDEDAPIERKVRALKGLTLALPQPGSSTDVMAREALRAYGVDVDTDVTVKPITDPPALVTAMREKQVDGFAFSAPTSVQPVADGYASVWFSVSDLPKYEDMPWIDVVTSREYLEQHRDNVVKFVRALHAGAADLKQDKAAASARIKDEYFADLDESVFRDSFDLVVPTTGKGFEPTESGLDQLLEVVNASTDNQLSVEFSGGYDTTVVRDAVEGRQ